MLDTIGTAVGFVGIGVAFIGLSGLILGAIRPPPRHQRPEGLDPFGLWFWYEHRRAAWACIAGGLFLVLLVQPIVN